MSIYAVLGSCMWFALLYERYGHGDLALQFAERAVQGQPGCVAVSVLGCRGSATVSSVKCGSGARVEVAERFDAISG